jgi:PAS domain S-box-containing protein
VMEQGLDRVRIAQAVTAREQEIQDRARTEAVLRENLARLDSLIDNMQTGVLFEDENRRVLHANQAFARMFGLDSLQQIIGAGCAGVAGAVSTFFVDPEAFVRDLEAQLAARQRVLGTVLPLADGRVLERDYVPILVGGEHRGHLCLYRDVTDRVQAEEQARLNTERMASLLQLNQMADASLQDITDFALEEAVRLTRSQIGYLAFVSEDETLLTMHAWSRASLELCALAERPIHYPLATTGLWGEAVRRRRPVITNDYAAPSPWKKGFPAGHVPLYRHLNVPIVVGGRVVAVAGVGNKASDYDEMDVRQLTLLMEGMWRLLDRKQAEARRETALEALRQERDLSQALAAAAAVVSRTLDPDQVLDRLLEQVSRVVPNDAANIMLIDDDNRARVARWRGYERFGTEAFVARIAYDIDAVPNLRYMATSGEPMSIHDTATYPGWVDAPEHAWLRSYAAAPIRIRGVVTGFLNVDSATPGFFTPLHAAILRAFADHAAIALTNARLYREIQQDLIERKRLEAQLIWSQKMEAIGRLAGGVAHDFNNHLTAIGGYAELLLLSLDANDPRRGDVAQICRAADRSATLTRQLLAFSRKQIIQPQIVDLNELIATMERMLRRLIGEDVTLVTALHPATYRVRVDPGQIEQVLMNLTINARDAMPRGGRLLIETAALEVGEGGQCQGVGLVPGPYALLSVSDDGVGMDAGMLSHLFEPFFTTKEYGKGTGLGLAMVYGIVKQSNGYIFAESEPGRGTRFSIYLPSAGEAARPAERPDDTAALYSGKGTILLVEDDTGVRAFARRVLEQSGYHVLAAADGDQALPVAQAYPAAIHLLLTDVVMPGALGGRALAVRLAAGRPDMRVLYMSGYPDDAIVHRGVLEEGIDLLHKPFTAATLAIAVRDILARA